MSGVSQGNFFREGIQKHSMNYLSQENFKLQIASWNVNAKFPSQTDIQKWLVDNVTGEEGSMFPEILVVGLQEVISLSPTNVIGGTVVKSLSNDHSTKWADLILSTVNRYNTESTYSLLASENMVGLCIHIFVDISILGCISEVATSFLPTGTGGYLGKY